MGNLQGKAEQAGQGEEHAPRLYRKVASRLMDELRAGRYQVGGRMPAERELAVQMGVSRPVVREALLALEVMGIIEVKIGSGAYILRMPDEEPSPSVDTASVTPIELAQALFMFEGEVAPLAAVNITDEELKVMEGAVVEMRREDGTFEAWQEAVTLFHLTMAKSTRNAVVERGMRDIWDIRSRSPECRRMLEQARDRNFRYSVAQHVEIFEALKARDPERARAAIKMHLATSIKHVLLVIEESAVADARAKVDAIRSRYMIGTDGVGA